jgi:hypothetical protein
MKAQILYDVREITGFVSGSDLHEIFREVCGEPSPSGHVEIKPAKLPAYVREELDKWVTIDTLIEYYRDCTAGEQYRPDNIKATVSQEDFVSGLLGCVGNKIADVAHIIREAGEKIIQ